MARQKIASASAPGCHVRIEKIENGHLLHRTDEDYNTKTTFHKSAPEISVKEPGAPKAGDGGAMKAAIAHLNGRK